VEWAISCLTWYNSHVILLYCRELADSEDATSFSKNTQAGDEQGKKCGEDIDNLKLAKSDETESDAEKAEAAKPLTNKWSQTVLQKEYRKFNLDLAPKVIFFYRNV
jgi:hypothetical protein